jgi:hypothetical protein
VPGNRAACICTGEIRFANAFRRCFRSPYAPDIFSAMYSKTFRRTRSGKRPLSSMQLIVVADRPEHLCMPRMIVHVVLRDNPSTSACSSTVTKPHPTNVLQISSIFRRCWLRGLIGLGILPRSPKKRPRMFGQPRPLKVAEPDWASKASLYPAHKARKVIVRYVFVHQVPTCHFARGASLGHFIQSSEKKKLGPDWVAN